MKKKNILLLSLFFNNLFTNDQVYFSLEDLIQGKWKKGWDNFQIKKKKF